LGIVENLGKRQSWTRGSDSTLEHLGVVVSLDYPLAPILPRGGWSKVEGVIQLLTRIPGTLDTRECLAAAFVLPHFRWAAPVLAPPPASLAADLFNALLRTSVRWYCQARFWASRLQLHPIFAAGLATFTHAARRLARSDYLDSSIALHAQSFGLQFVRWSDRGPLLSCTPDTADRIREVVQTLSDGDGCFDASSERGLHGLRVIGRLTLLATIPASRFDAEGAADIDVEASSHHLWRSFLLSLGHEDRRTLHIWRAGGASTPTRCQRMVSTICPWCDHQYASARHFVVDCPKFEAARFTHFGTLPVSASWLSRQPRVSVKSGWVVRSAHPSLDIRVKLQVSLCRLGIAVQRTYLDYRG